MQVGHVSDRSLSLQQVKETLAEIRGHLVPMPLGFLDVSICLRGMNRGAD